MGKYYYFSENEIDLENVYVGNIKINKMIPLYIHDYHPSVNMDLGQFDVIYLDADPKKIDGDLLPFIYAEYGKEHDIFDGRRMYAQRRSVLASVLGDSSIKTSDIRITGDNSSERYRMALKGKKVYAFISLNSEGAYYVSGILGENVDPELAYFPELENQLYELGEQIKGSKFEPTGKQPINN